ncbi:ABC transporter substrate-binding protein [Vibrio sp. SS-MA-C1-2]|uniref:ABC transporter substrate-binding protein n=1 Tax=Vibrio sp. SS-MA-C1-2 TaxID=2908646 RepID=UPI001F2999DF|nr:ABC transporter substrate-binding protein [Vibrio sp. SS-MA-C1-2]UJF17167.1 ABC transporter substrate-binding protein [Vibrio sp. SS-MA-C1-2]
MLINFKRTFISGAIIAAASLISLSTLAAPSADQNQLTIVPDFYPTMVKNFNPYLNTHLKTTTDFIFEPLVIFNQMHGNEPVMRLAENFSMSDDLLTVTFTLRDDVKWSDGKPFSVDDVIFSFNLIKENPELDQRGINKWLKEVKKSDNKVIFTLTEGNSNVPFELSFIPIVPKHIWQDVEKPASFTNDNPVGTGPFTEIATFTPQLYIQCRNPNYWDNDNLKVDCLRVPQIANNDQLLNKIINSELDWSSSFVPDIDSTYAAKNPNHKYWYPASGTQSFMLNFKTPKKGNNEAINNIDFRRAFSMAIDRQTIIDIAFYGSGIPNDYASGLGDSFKSWSDNAVYNQYKKFNTFDLEGAKALLKKTGFKDIDNDKFVETPSGEKIELEIQSPNGWSDFNNTVQLAVEQLNDAGINAKAKTPDFSVYNSSMLDGSYDVSYTNYLHGADPHLYWNSAFNSHLQKGEGMPRFSMHFFSNAELDTLLDSFYKTADKEEQLSIAHQIQKIIAENQVTVPMMSAASMFQYNETRFTGWWNADKPKGRPMVWAGIPERLLQVLDLEPVIKK